MSKRKSHDQPFKPFRIRLVNNTTYDITEPWMVTVGESSRDRRYAKS